MGAQSVISAATPVVNFAAYTSDTTGATDSSSALVSAAAVAAATCSSAGTAVAILFPPGKYSFHEVDLTPYPNCILLYSPVPLQARFYYNGAGGAGSYMMKFAKIGAGGWDGIQFQAVNTGNTVMAQNVLLLTGQLDMVSVCRNSQFAHSWGDAIYHTGYLVNFHCDNVRWDGVGGFGFTLTGAAGQDSRPFTITNWTMANQVNPNLVSYLEAQGLYDGVHWGKALLHLNNAIGVVAYIGPGRFEPDQPLIEIGGNHDESSFVYEENTSSSNPGYVILDGVGGYGSTVNYDPLISTTNASTLSITVRDAAVYHSSAVWKERDNQSYHGRIGDAAGLYQYGPAFSGAIFHDVKQDSSTALGSSRNDFFQLGSVLWHAPNLISPGQAGIGAYSITPSLANCYVRPSHNTISSTAVVTAASTTVTGMGTVSSYLPGDCISIAGAGPAGAALETYIVSTNYDAASMVIAATPSTSVNPATITWDVPQWREFGFDATRMSAAPTTGAWYKGEVVWNSNPALGSVLGWICTASGSPGTWAALQTLGSSGATLETNGTANGSQSLLNLIQGTNVTLSDNGSGGITINAGAPQGNVITQLHLTGQTASLSSTAFGSAMTATGQYRIEIAVCTTAQGTGGTVSASVTYGSGAGESVSTTGSANLNTLNHCTMNALAPMIVSGYQQTYSTTVTGAAGSPAYDLWVTVTRVQ
jgi:hypothetical protein